MNMEEIKNILRVQMRAQLERISPAVRAVESIGLCERLEAQLPSARAILFFAPLPDEPDVWPVLERSMALGTVCALPYFDASTQAYGARVIQKIGTDLVAGKFGVREPAAQCAAMPLNQLDLVLVPGLAFDRFGSRLGRGRGFYDRLLGEVSGVKCGICYQGQLLESLPTEGH
ncbi:MAG: 5-formyltetrahydrofolate cyclo-ligase, partial [Betaproteobacteria bacterium]|nr:5-formyltetrahydrofolate cyclo-ligase [Betaproteobacteria bacterium]